MVDSARNRILLFVPFQFGEVRSGNPGGYVVEIVLQGGVDDRHLALTRFKRLLHQPFFQLRRQANLEGHIGTGPPIKIRHDVPPLTSCNNSHAM